MKRSLPPLNALRAFEAAARLGRMNAAAEELCVTPGAISRQVRLLEQYMDVPLFDGSKTKPQLTSTALALLPAVSAALDQIEAAVKLARVEDARGLTVACFSTMMVKCLIPRLFDLSAKHPDIEIRLQTTGGADDLLRERIDVLIAVEDSPIDSAERSALFAEMLGPVLAPALAARISLQSPADLAGHTLFQAKGRPDAWALWAQAFGCPPSAAVPVVNGPVFDHYYFALEASLGGLGIAVAPRHLVADDVRAGRLLAPFGFCPSGLHYVAKHRAPRSQKVAVFCEWLKINLGTKDDLT